MLWATEYHAKNAHTTSTPTPHIDRLARICCFFALALIDTKTNAPIGTSSYADIRPEHRGLEIGYTWISPRVRGGAANAEMKRLMLAHVFETDVFEGGPAIRVMLKTDELNLRSQRAMEKIGAKREGVLRNHLIMPSGRVRHSAVYSITIEDWAGVRDILDARIADSGDI